jgi:hypothetical protein
VPACNALHELALALLHRAHGRERAVARARGGLDERGLRDEVLGQAQHAVSAARRREPRAPRLRELAPTELQDERVRVAMRRVRHRRRGHR